MSMFPMTAARWIQSAQDHVCVFGEEHRLGHDVMYEDKMTFFCRCCDWRFSISVKVMMDSLMSVPPPLRGVLCTETGRGLLAEAMSHPGIVGVDYEEEIKEI